MKIVITKSNGIFYAEVVESNGDVFALAQDVTRNGLKAQIASMGYVVGLNN